MYFAIKLKRIIIFSSISDNCVIFFGWETSWWPTCVLLIANHLAVNHILERWLATTYLWFHDESDVYLSSSTAKSRDLINLRGLTINLNNYDNWNRNSFNWVSSFTCQVNTNSSLNETILNFKTLGRYKIMLAFGRFHVIPKATRFHETYLHCRKCDQAQNSRILCSGVRAKNRINLSVLPWQGPKLGCILPSVFYELKKLVFSMLCAICVIVLRSRISLEVTLIIYTNVTLQINFSTSCLSERSNELSSWTLQPGPGIYEKI